MPIPVLQEHKIKTFSLVYRLIHKFFIVKITKLFFASIIALAPGVAIAQNQLPQIIETSQPLQYLGVAKFRTIVSNVSFYV